MNVQHTNLTLYFSQIESQVGDPLCLLPIHITLHFLIIFPDDVWDEVLALREGICLTPIYIEKVACLLQDARPMSVKAVQRAVEFQ
jgi:hypothetical protein